MATATEVAQARGLTVDELLELDDGVERRIIDGELRENRHDEEEDEPVTKRNKEHAAVEAAFAECLRAWARTQPRPRGRVFSGEVGCALRPETRSSVGIDVAYFSAETMAAQPGDDPFIVGVPVVAVEIVSPSDRFGAVEEKVLDYLDAGVAHVWVVSPTFQTITIYRPGLAADFRNITGTLTAEPELPGFSAPLTDIFED